ncbi:vomeronasal 1 receptor monDomV1R1266 [Monodelphis domestica]|uniref:Vomeronasal type-1 receptor n=1 Tax=Monodelphis domestica TaxID=13616 RepID=A0A5F8GNL3_MONDO|nr:vomeronasal 1 receptor monDomV1R1266 [Monodelphis domestica]
MFSIGEILGIAYLLQTIIGVLGNFYLIYHYCFHFEIQKSPRRIHLIFIQLSFANAMFLLCRGIPMTIFSWGWKFFLNDVVCKIITYLQRVFRGLSICSTSLLSVFQAVVISPSSTKWAILKVKLHKSMAPCCILCWILNLLIDAALLVYITGPRNITKSKWKNKIRYCFMDTYNMDRLKLQYLNAFYDFIIVAAMTVSSAYMVFVLYQHRQQVQHIHSTKVYLRASPEIRAIKVILLLVSIFFFFNSACAIIAIYTDYFKAYAPWQFYVPMFLSMSFQAICPFVLIGSETWSLWKFCCSIQRIKCSCVIPLSIVSRQIHMEPPK